MVKKRNYDDWSKKELIKEIDALRKQKTYGLVWEKDKTIEKFDYFINWAGDKTKESIQRSKYVSSFKGSKIKRYYD
jgi:hypothetical protein